jgi:hypothetical protein
MLIWSTKGAIRDCLAPRLRAVLTTAPPTHCARLVIVTADSPLNDELLARESVVLVAHPASHTDRGTNRLSWVLSESHAA